MGRNLSLGGYDHWKTTDPAERWPDERPQEDEDMPEVTALIENARPCPFPGDRRQPCISGQIRDDARGRWPNGTDITTSRVASIVGDIATTQNSVYRIRWAPDVTPEAVQEFCRSLARG